MIEAKGHNRINSIGVIIKYERILIMINTVRHGIKELDSSELSTLSQLANLNTNADLIDKAIDRWGTATWSNNTLNVTSETPSQELYTGLSISFMLTATNPGDASIKLDSLEGKSLLNSTGSVMPVGFLTAGQIYTVTYDGTAFRINNVAHATSANSATSATNADTVDGMHAADFATAAQGAKADAALPMSGYTAADILSKLKTVDGAGSDLDADTLDGLDSTAFATAAQGAKADAALPMSGYTAVDILTKIKTVDGVGSGLDADLLDGKQSIEFATAEQGTKAEAALPAASYTAEDILAKLKTVDGEGSGLYADTAGNYTTDGGIAAKFKTQDENFAALSGIGRTTETVKGNADAIASLSTSSEASFKAITQRLDALETSSKTNKPEKLYAGSPNTSTTTLYTVPESTKTVVKCVVISNTTTTAATITLSFAGINLINAYSVEANDTVAIDLSLVLNASETITALQGTEDAITLYISGLEAN